MPISLRPRPGERDAYRFQWPLFLGACGVAALVAAALVYALVNFVLGSVPRRPRAGASPPPSTSAQKVEPQQPSAGASEAPSPAAAPAAATAPEGAKAPPVRDALSRVMEEELLRAVHAHWQSVKGGETHWASLESADEPMTLFEGALIGERFLLTSQATFGIHYVRGGEREAKAVTESLTIVLQTPFRSGRVNLPQGTRLKRSEGGRWAVEKSR